MTTALNLLVIRSPDPEAAVSFYELLGLHFVKHRHGTGPEHFSADLDNFLFEIYRGQPGCGANRIGFRVDGLDNLLRQLASVGTPVVSEPRVSPWGYRAVVQDPDGLKVELLEITKNPSDDAVATVNSTTREIA